MRETPGQRIVIYRIGQIGDTIISLPAIWAIRQNFPVAHVCLLTDQHPQTNHVLAICVLPREGLLDGYLTYPANSAGVNPKALLALLPKLRRQRFDTLVYLAPRQRTRWQVWRDLAFFRLAGIRYFHAHRGFEPLPGPGQGGSLPRVQHEADHLLYRLSLSGIPVPPPGEGCMDLRLTDREHAEASDWLTARLGERLGQLPLIALGPGSKWASKLWPAERFVALGQCLIARLGISPIVFGGPEIVP